MFAHAILFLLAALTVVQTNRRNFWAMVILFAGVLLCLCLMWMAENNYPSPLAPAFADEFSRMIVAILFGLLTGVLFVKYVLKREPL